MWRTQIGNHFYDAPSVGKAAEMSKGIHAPLGITADEDGLQKIEAELSRERQIGPSPDFSKEVLPILIAEIRRLRGDSQTCADPDAGENMYTSMHPRKRALNGIGTGDDRPPTIPVENDPNLKEWA